MSVLVAVKFPGDVAKFRASLAERASEYAAIADRAKQAGAIHHRFGAGSDFVLVVDEWESAEQFEAFMSAPELQEFIEGVGGARGAGEAEITVTEAVSSPDEF
jgi:quinol monooxygenase YgiN